MTVERMSSPGGEETGEGGRQKLTSFYNRSLYFFVMPNVEHARALRKKETWAEKLMWRCLRDRRFSGYKFRRQQPKGIYHLDFFCEEASVAIELDGSGHGHPGQLDHDAEREKYLAIQGIKVLRFWNSHLRRNAQGIRDTIFEELQRRAPHPLPDYTRPALGKTG
jgi:very-short-patch-repair endonuclease